MDTDNELTTPKLKELLLQNYPDLKASERTIARARQELGWVHQTAKYCQMVREANKDIRLEWAQKMISNNEQFDDVIFTNESTLSPPCENRNNVPAGLYRSRENREFSRIPHRILQIPFA